MRSSLDEYAQPLHKMAHYTLIQDDYYESAYTWDAANVYSQGATNAVSPSVSWEDSEGNSGTWTGSSVIKTYNGLSQDPLSSAYWLKGTFDSGFSGSEYVRMQHRDNASDWLYDTLFQGGNWQNVSNGDTFLIQVGLVPKKGGIPDGTPTYLETLDKLDQWSSAHYVPNGRNILNL